MSGRKPIDIDVAEVERLAGLGLREAGICAELGISEDTLGRRKNTSAVFAAALKRGKARAQVKVASRLMDKIEAGDVTAMIWWEKTRYGMKDQTDVTSGGKPINDGLPRFIIHGTPETTRLPE